MSAHEKQAWEQTDINVGMDAAQIRSRMEAARNLEAKAARLAGKAVGGAYNAPEQIRQILEGVYDTDQAVPPPAQAAPTVRRYNPATGAVE